jgi:CHAT domain-containing protein
MVTYYDELKNGAGRAEAMRRVQLNIILGGKKNRHPYFWASFIPIGEWANLGGKR